MFKRNLLHINIMMILSVGASLSAQAGSCTVSSSTISTTSDCETTENSLVQVSVKDSAKLAHTTTGNVTIINSATTNSDLLGWDAHGTYGIRVFGAGAQYQLNSAVSKSDIKIDVGTTNANVRGRGVTVENGGKASIYANSLTINSAGSYTNDWNANNALYASSGGILNIYADEVIAHITSAKTPNGTIAAVGGTINIQGNSGLSITTITNTGSNGSSSGISAEAGGIINLERINIDMTGASNCHIP